MQYQYQYQYEYNRIYRRPCLDSSTHSLVTNMQRLAAANPPPLTATTPNEKQKFPSFSSRHRLLPQKLGIIIAP
jgi:hypothetical protein